MTQYKEDCRECPRLVTFLDQVKLEQPSYFCKPVPPFGDTSIRLLIVGLAPGMQADLLQAIMQEFFYIKLYFTLVFQINESQLQQMTT
jgi:hypothetical protein